MASCQFWMISLLLLAGVFTLGIKEAQAEKKTGLSTARREDVPFIRCRVCEILSKQLVRQVKEKRDKAAPKKITEFDIIDIAENICNMKKEESDWILKLDIVENKGKLELVEQSVEGACKRDCKTIERACQEVMGEHDTDVAEYLYKAGSTRAGLMKLLCRDLSKACVAKLPPLPKYRGPEELFTPKVGKEAEMDKLMRTLQDVPAGTPKLKVYSREDIENNPGIAYSGGRSPRDPDDDEDYEDDDEDMYEFKPAVRTWRDSVAKLGAKVGAQTQKVVQTSLKRVKKTTRRIKRWWSGKKPITKFQSQSSAIQKSSSDSGSDEL
ncbi:hypothetical protein KC19_1G239500 [Ceratodon purpureus]|uniref:Saposin B-type domain-containing protein n=1 Tax=Ceratodon purpureus TaxID=3225 RepID=A0A8T0J994_CERPU|nr:hypothetical protein KC19_1G239500 [Ceratodon purpureus]KAG0592288.1 hypothetical protein KC19_1G239500 [Ceratodon purpureus]